MSISDTIQAIAAPVKAQGKASRPRTNRIRRGQKLDDVVSQAEQRLSQITLHQGEASASASSLSSETTGSSLSPPSAIAAGGDSPFQLQEYLAMLVHRDPHNVEAITALPTEADIESLTSTDKPKSKDDFSAPEDDSIVQNVDTDVWVYEQLRRLVLDLTTPWLTSLQQECDKHARPQTCAAMNAGDWMYLCASHGEEKQCCAIDYMVHTLDGATSLLNSARHFPSRTYVPNTSLRHFGSIARRLSRIFVHAWCYHKDVFMACETETSLYSRFYVLVETYDLTATDNLPPRPGHASSSSMESNEAAYDVNEAERSEFSRGANPAFTLNGTTAKRERSGTAAYRSLLTHSLQQPQPPSQTAPQPSQVDAVGLMPPPAPSPRPTAILSRPDHEEGDDDAPAWTSFAQNSVKEQASGAEKAGSSSSQHDQDDEDDEDDEDEEDSGEDVGDDERTQKVGGLSGKDGDATISLRGADIPASLKALHGEKEVEKEAGGGKEAAKAHSGTTEQTGDPKEEESSSGDTSDAPST